MNRMIMTCMRVCFLRLRMPNAHVNTLHLEAVMLCFGCTYRVVEEIFGFALFKMNRQISMGEGDAQKVEHEQCVSVSGMTVSFVLCVRIRYVRTLYTLS